ncbi:MAG: hypothetical protein RJA52_1196 [Bacteroidota bacterium]|jgi:hypothetical protein
MPYYEFTVRFYVEGLRGMQFATVSAQNAAEARNHIRSLWGSKLKSIHSVTRS